MDKLTASIRVWMTPDAKLILQRLAEADRRDLSEYCRVQLEKHAAMLGASKWLDQKESTAQIVPFSAKGTQ